jgi:hypothetical protein
MVRADIPRCRIVAVPSLDGGRDYEHHRPMDARAAPGARKLNGLRIWQVGILIFLLGCLLFGMLDSIRLECSRGVGGVQCTIERSLLGMTRSTVQATGVTDVALDVKVRRRKSDHYRVELMAREGQVRVLGDASGEAKEWLESIQRFLGDSGVSSLSLAATPWLGWIAMLALTGLVIALPRIIRTKAS